MDIIHLLPDSVANQIAAGEVVQRPSSCLKELVENSLDAGAHHIRVIVRDAGRTLLQVVDDGMGMSATDVRMAFERHATSKISSAEDLFTLRTMGFRGEALPSICAVSQVEVMTRREEDEVGTLLEIHGSKVVRQEICQCPVGTNFKVKNLFYNVKARRSFLKTDQTELRNLLQEFHHIVLVYPQVQFTFVSNDEVLQELVPGTSKQRIEQVFGKGTGRSFTGTLVDVKTETPMVNIRGFVGKPEFAGRQAQQYFFVNGRYMRHPYFHKAVLAAYSGMLLGDYAPSYFIYFEVDPARIDVNIHPTKIEIKFADEQSIFQILTAAVRESLGKFDLTPSLDFTDDNRLELPVLTDDLGLSSAPRVVVDPNYSPFKPQTYRAPHSQNTSPEMLFREPVMPEEPQEEDLFGLDLEAVQPYQYDNRFILLPCESGLMMVHQHRAHYTVLFYELIAQMSHEQGQMQQILFPDVIELSPDDMTLVEQIRDELRFMGFELEQLTPKSYSITGVPGILGANNPVSCLRNIIDHVRETQSSAHAEWKRQMALSLAKDAAISSGKRLSETEMRDLLNRLFALKSGKIAPDGKLVISVILHDEIAKRFIL